MYKNADNLEEGSVLSEYDICIVGTGAAGISIAKKLLGANKKVLLLASGISSDRGYDPSGGRQTVYQGTLGSFMQKVDPDFMTRSRLRMFGGTTNHIEFFTTPLIQEDFEPREGYRQAAWPFGIEELNKYYPEANTSGNFGPFNYDDIDFWAEVLDGKPYQAEKDDKLQNAIFHAQFDEEIHDFQVHYGEQLKASKNVTVLFNANVLEINSSNDSSHVTSLACATIKDGNKGLNFSVALGKKGTYTLATGGIEPIRLLKISNDLGNNEKDMLGRGFMLHPVIVEGATVHFNNTENEKQVNFYNRQEVSLRKNTHDDHYKGIPRKDANRDDCSFTAWGVLTPTIPAMNEDKIGNFRVWITYKTDGSSALLGFNWEQVPNEDSRLTLDPEVRDPIFDQPVSHLDWHLLKEDKHTIRKCLEYCNDYFMQRGASKFEVETNLSGGPEDWLFAPTSGALKPGDHHMGGLRMSTDPEYGIVDSNCKIHTVDNLYIAGSSVFPTVGYANPTISIVALSLRLGEHLDGL